MTLNEAADYSKRSTSTLRGWILFGHLKAIKIEDKGFLRWFIKEKDLDVCLKKKEADRLEVKEKTKKNKLRRQKRKNFVVTKERTCRGCGKLFQAKKMTAGWRDYHQDCARKIWRHESFKDNISEKLKEKFAEIDERLSKEWDD
jgi:hypothetical protein